MADYETDVISADEMLAAQRAIARARGGPPPTPSAVDLRVPNLPHPAPPTPSAVDLRVPNLPPPAAPSGAGPAVTPGRSTSTRLRGFPQVGETMDGYRFRELLGQGNMGRIYRARDTLGRNVAIKVIKPEVASSEGLARFEREGQAMAAIPRHPHVVTVHSTGKLRGMPYLVLDYVPGQTLGDVLKRGPLPPEQAALVAEKLGRALDAVHSAGVLHRDLKPANVLIRDEDGEPVLSDFGLAGLAGSNRLTQTGDILGTPLYMAPEQILGHHGDIDGRADVWALGVMLYEMIAGRLPFMGHTLVEVSQQVSRAEPPPLARLCSGIDPALVALVNRALSKEKGRRFATPGEFADALRVWRRGAEDAVAGEAGPQGPPRAALVGAGILLGVVVVSPVVWLVASGARGDGDAPVPVEPTPTADDAAARAEREAQAAIAAWRQGVEEALAAGRQERAQEALATPPPPGAIGAGWVEEQLGVADRAAAALARSAIEPRELIPWVELHARLVALAPDVEQGTALGDACLGLLLRREENGHVLLGSEDDGLGLVKALGDARIPASHRPGAKLLAQIFSGLRIGDRYPQLAVALTQMGVDLGYEHITRLGHWKPTKIGTFERYLLLRHSVQESRGGGQVARATHRQVMRDFIDFLAARGEELPATVRTRALFLAADYSGLAKDDDPSAMAELLEGALGRLETGIAIDPQHVPCLTRLAQCHVNRSLLRIARNDVAGAREDAVLAADFAMRAIDGLDHVDYLFPPDFANVFSRAFEVAADALPLAGRDAEFRRLLEGLQERRDRLLRGCVGYTPDLLHHWLPNFPKPRELDARAAGSRQKGEYLAKAQGGGAGGE